MAISEKPWSDYKESDYSLEQWHRACLVHLHDGAPTSKGECKLPVRTPEGTLNRNGVHAAAAALAGARGGMTLSPDKRRAAAAALVRCYHQLDEKPAASLQQSDTEKVESFLKHINIAGPGAIEVNRGGGGFDESKVKRDKGGKFSKIAGAPMRNREPRTLEELKARQNQELVDKFGDNIMTMTADDYLASLPPSQDVDGTRKELYEMLVKQIKEQFAFQEKHGSAAHSDPGAVDNFLAHYGRKGMKWGQRIFTSVTGRGGSKSGESKNSGGSKKSSEPSHDDAVAFMKAAQTPPNQLSTKEIQEAVQRANFEKQYRSMVLQDPNAELRQKVESLQLRKQYGQLSAEMNPTKVQRAQNFAKQVGDGYDSYKKLDDATGGMLSHTVRKALGLPQPKTSRNEQLENELSTLRLEAERKNLLKKMGPDVFVPRHAKGVRSGKHVRVPDIPEHA